MHWLARLFTVPRKTREAIAKVPGIHFVVSQVVALAIGVAQGAVDQHVSDPAAAEALKAAIEGGIKHAIPVPDEAAAGPSGAVVDGLIGTALPLVGLPQAPAPEPVAAPSAEGG